jgi:hypothetical protein
LDAICTASVSASRAIATAAWKGHRLVSIAAAIIRDHLESVRPSAIRNLRSQALSDTVDVLLNGGRIDRHRILPELARQFFSQRELLLQRNVLCG